MEGSHKYCVGIDLGTTNIALASNDLESSLETKTQQIWQRISPTEIGLDALLPATLFFPTSYDAQSAPLELPWGDSGERMLGQWARHLSSRVLGRGVNSAKSWLAHPQVDPSEPFLPWARAEDIQAVSPLDASTIYLLHLVSSWNYDHPDHFLQNQQVVLTVPASFEDRARRLTAQAATQAGLSVRLLEEPQAAFYGWWSENREETEDLLESGETILVVDIGGGTTDFSLIQYLEGDFKRLAVGDHLMLGGDNIDLFLAHHAQSQWDLELDSVQWSTLKGQCAFAKESLFDPQNPLADVTVTLQGRGSGLMGSSHVALLEQSSVREQIMEGFFPFVEWEEVQERLPGQAGLRDWALPYEQDPRFSAHLGSFLKVQKQKFPRYVLFNGGATAPLMVRERLLQQLERWSGQKVVELSVQRPEQAVARGAAYYASLLTRGEKTIESSSARSYYIGLEGEKAICVAPRNLREGSVLEAREHTLELLMNRPVSFPFYSSSYRPEDQVGALVAKSQLMELSRMQTVVSGKKESEERARVYLESKLNALGILELWLSEEESRSRYQLEFPLNQEHTGQEGAALLDPNIIAAKDKIESVFSTKPSRLTRRSDKLRPRNLLSYLEDQVGEERQEWSLPLLRSFADRYLELSSRRRSGPEFEAYWLNASGYCLRPGRGVQLDDWRMAKVEELLPEWLSYPKDSLVGQQWWVFLRRIAPGLSTNAQNYLWQQISPLLIAGRKHWKTKIRGEMTREEHLEMLRLASSLEGLETSEKLELIGYLASTFKTRVEDCWMLARLMNRQPMGPYAHKVVPSMFVEPWLEQFEGWEWEAPHMASLAVVAMCKPVGDKAREIDRSLRERAVALLKERKQWDRWEKAMSGEEQDSQLEDALMGEKLPLGLRLS